MQPQFITLKGRAKNLTGQRFGRLVALGPIARMGKRIVWLCQCDCGNETRVQLGDLRCGNTKSCGCIAIERIRQRNRDRATHGMTDTPEFRTWRGMINRCTNAFDQSYSGYGGRGITVCEQWLIGFENFLNDMGRRPSAEYSIERIDNNAGYCPENCKWATRTEQQNNRRTTRILEFNGESLTVGQWAHRLSIPKGTIYTRLYRNWPIEKILFASSE